MRSFLQFFTPFILVAARAGLCPAAEPVGGLVELRAELNPATAVRVSIELEAGGEMVLGAPQGAAEAGEPRKLPMRVAARLQYDERRLPVGKIPPAPGALLSVRYYDRAEATIRVDTAGLEPRLADDRRLVAVAGGSERPILFSPAGPFDREQLDLVDIVGNTAYLDALLPGKAVADGDSWSHPAAVMTGLLALDSIAFCEVESILDEHNAHFAKIRMAGFVHGTIDGAATEHELRGVYLFDRRLQRVTRLNLAVGEKRSIGSATPGVDGVARLQITVEPVELSAKLADDVVTTAVRGARVVRDQRTTSVHDLAHEAAAMGFRLSHDRQWFVTNEQRESVTMRRVEPSGLVAQCTLTVLPPKSEGRQTSLEQFQKDILFSLGRSFEQLVSSRQWKNRAGHYCYEVVLRGTAEDVPVEWHYYLVQQESGHRVSVAVTIEGTKVERLGDADRQLVESLELFAPQRPAQTAVKPPAGSSR